jgi:hypothetical protein
VPQTLTLTGVEQNKGKSIEKNMLFIAGMLLCLQISGTWLSAALSLPDFYNNQTSELTFYELEEVKYYDFYFGWEYITTENINFEKGVLGMREFNEYRYGSQWLLIGYPPVSISKKENSPPGSSIWYHQSWTSYTPWTNPTTTTPPNPYTKLETASTSSGYGGRTANSIYDLATSGDNLKYLYRVHMNVFEGNSSTPVTSWSSGGMPCDATGDVYLPILDPTVVDVSPTASSSWYTYSNVSSTKVSFGLAFRNTGPLTAMPNAQGIGYDKHDAVVAITGSGGLALLPEFNGIVANFQETSGIVPNVPVLRAVSYVVNRDVESSFHTYNPATTHLDSEVSRNWSPNSPPGAGNDNTGLHDGTPDSVAQIFNADAPGFGVTSDSAINLPVGAILAMRFNATEWANVANATGAIVTPLLEWHSHITVKTTAAGWVRVGAKNEIEIGHASTIFTLTEAQSY